VEAVERERNNPRRALEHTVQRAIVLVVADVRGSHKSKALVQEQDLRIDRRGQRAQKPLREHGDVATRRLLCVLHVFNSVGRYDVAGSLREHTRVAGLYSIWFDLADKDQAEVVEEFVVADPEQPFLRAKRIQLRPSKRERERGRERGRERERKGKE
jgi:hypothetical protein